MDTAWRTLHHTHDLEEVRVLVTTLNAMEFTVRVTDPDAGVVDPFEVEGAQGPQHGLLVEVREQDFADLADVRDEVLAEQHEFTEAMAARELRNRRVTVAVIIAAAIGLVALGVVKYLNL